MIVAWVLDVSTTLGIGSFLTVASVAGASFLVQRKTASQASSDRIIELLNEERDALQERADRLGAEVRDLKVEQERLRGEIAVLKGLPDVQKLYELMESHDARMQLGAESFATTLAAIASGQVQLVEQLRALAAGEQRLADVLDAFRIVPRSPQARTRATDITT